MNTPRNEYPRPQFMRDDWINLNGFWQFAYDDENKGIECNWHQRPEFDRQILVPFTYQCELSGIHEHDFHDIIWYARTITVTKEMLNKRIILHFGAVDYLADVWVNGQHIVSHEGGHVPFSADISYVLHEGDNLIVLRAVDDSFDLELPRGKQYWRPKSEGIFYTRTTGIWQTVWLEVLEQVSIGQIRLTPDIDSKRIRLEYTIEGSIKDLELNVKIKLKDIVLVDDSLRILSKKGQRDFYLDQSIGVDWQLYEMWTWSPEKPILFDLDLVLTQKDEKKDTVHAYFAMRKVSIIDGQFMLNNRPYYQKMVLDQGYWEESLLTAPSDEAFITDIRLTKEMGFNGVRKHQKIEDPRYLYHADRMGLLVWGEIANAYVYSNRYVARITKEWMAMIERDYNHPCIVAWTPLNESWGVDGIMHNEAEQAHAAALYYLTKSLDTTRPVISNDGWDHTKTDLLTIHDYESEKSVLLDRYKDMATILSSKHTGRGMFAQGWRYDGQPVIVSEFGGISYKKSEWEGWGYSAATSDEDFLVRYHAVISAMLESPLIQGFVYTQITDVEQEINGLLTYARQPKVDLSIIRKINEGRWQPDDTQD